MCGIVGLAGAGGIGKSALACHFAELHRESFPDGVIGLRVDGKDAAALAREFARHRGEEIDPEDTRDPPTIMQETFGHRRALLIFDNAEDVALAALRPGGEVCAVIVTTRDRQLPLLLGIPAEGQIDLAPLPYVDALLLLERLLGRDRVAAAQAAADEIIELVGRLPLALQIVGATLQIQGWRELPNYAASLREERSRLSKLQIRGAAHLDVRASFSLSLRLLGDEEIDFFACLSVCAQDGFSLRAATAAGNCDEETAHERLGSLFRLSLLNLHQSNISRFVFHPLIRLFARELASERSLLDAAAERHARYFVGLVKSGEGGEWATAAVLAAELDDIILAAEWLQEHEEDDYEFIFDLEPFLHSHGHWLHAVKLMAGFLELAGRKGDANAQVRLRIKQAKYLSLQGEWGQAQGILEPIAGILEGIESQHLKLRLEAMWLNTLGGILQRRGRFEDAVESFRASASIEQRLGDIRGAAVALTSLGGLLQRQGNFDEAVEVLRQSAAIETTLGNKRGQAMVLNSLGGVLQRQGHFDDAVDAFKQSSELLVELGDLRGQAMILTSLGGVLQRQGHFEDAAQSIRQSIEIEEKIGNRRGLAMALNSLGGVLQRQGRFAEAEGAFRRSLEILEELNDQRGLAMVLNSLGGVLERVGRLEDAVDMFGRSIEIGEELGDRRHLAMAHTSFGRALLSHGKVEAAVVELRRGFVIDEELGNPRGVGVVGPMLVRALLKQGAHEEALEFCERALAVAPKNDRLLELREQLTSQSGTLDGILKTRGTIKRIIPRAAGYLYGFIIPEDGREDVYFHGADVEPDSLSRLAQGARVEFERRQGRKGPVAVNLKVVN